MTKTFNYYLEYLEEYNKSITEFIESSDKFTDEFSKLKNEFKNNLSALQNKKIISINNLKNEHEQDLIKLEQKKKKLLGEINRYRFIFEDGTTKFGIITPEISFRIEELKNAVLELDHIRLDKLNKQYEIKLENSKIFFDKTIESLTIAFENDADNLLNDARIYFEKELSNYNVDFNKFNPTKDLKLINEEITTFTAANFVPITEIGTFEKTIEIFDSKLTKEIKIILPFINTKSILVIHNEDSTKELNDIHDTIITRSLISTNVGKINLTLTDLKGVGYIFREFVPLSHQCVKLANNRVTFEKSLSECEERLQEVSVKYTSSSKQSNFRSLGEYNYNKIAKNQLEDLIPQHIHVVYNLSYDADELLLRKINKLISNGNNNGTQFFISWNIEDNSDELLEKLLNNKDLIVIDLVSNRSNYIHIKESIKLNVIEESKIHEFIDSFNHHLKELSNKEIKENFIDTIPQKENWFQSDSSQQVSIPIGKSKQHRGEQLIEIKTNDYLSHIMLSGGNGSGKTNFLKTFITSAALNYSPESLEFYLIDLKNGIGFDIFRKYQLPHVKMFAMGAENELILNLLDSLVDEMNRRLNLFTEKGVEDINKFNKISPDQKIKRTILIIDEFSTIFEEDSPYQDEICAKLAPLAKKARAAGINLFFSTQNFNHVSHSFNKLKSEIPIRIVLKSSTDAAYSLLDSSNDAMKYVNTIGDGVLNNRQGRKLDEKDNEFFKGYLLENEDLGKILIDLKNECSLHGFKENEQLVYDNLAQAQFKNNLQLLNNNRWSETREEELNLVYKPKIYKKFHLYLGEPTVISEEHFKIELERNYNENILVTGINKNVIINTLYNILASISYTFAPGEIGIQIFSFLDEDENHEYGFQQLDRLKNCFDYSFIAKNHLNELIKLEKELKFRQNSNNNHHKKIFCFFVGLEKAKLLHKENSYELNIPGKIFNDILKDGNQYNFHSICEMRIPSALNKILLSGAIASFKHRIVFHLGSSEESLDVIDNKMAGYLYKKDEPHTLYRAIYYNADFEKIYTKFKTYDNLVNDDLFYPANFEVDYPFEISAFHSDNLIVNESIKDSNNEIEPYDYLNALKDLLENNNDENDIIDIKNFN